MEREKKTLKDRIPQSLRFGVICIAFLIIGYQLALFLHRAAVLEVEARRDAPDTVFVYEAPAAGGDGGEGEEAGGRRVAAVKKKEAGHPPSVRAVREAIRKVRSFRFNPNEVSLDELQQLGFSEKQALAIDNYRRKGGRFHTKEDFAKSYVVSDSVYHRLESYIDIPRLDINRADSSAFDALPGIGPYFAAQMVKYRKELGGYSCAEQLLEIYNFGAERLERIRGMIVCSPPNPFGLWQADAEELRRHPYIKNYRTAAAIVLFRENTPADCLSVAALQRAGIISQSQAVALSRCVIAPAL